MAAIEENRHLKRRDRQALLAEELSEVEVDAIRKAEVPSQYAYLDAEVKDLDL